MKAPDVMIANRTRRRFSKRLLVCAVAGALALALGVAVEASAAAASTLYVAQGGSDSGNTCANANAPCATLSYAVTQAVPGDTIDLSGSVADNVEVPGTLSPLTISGITTPAILSGAVTGSSVLEIDPGASVTVDDLTLEGGASASGGGIDNLGTLTLSSCTVSGNVAATGGGIDNSGTLSVSDGAISDNQALSTSGPAGLGGGIYDTGTLSVTGSAISGNTATNPGGLNEGAGIYGNGGAVTVAGSTVSANTSQESGGGLYITGGSLEVVQSTISGNASGGEGGGVYANSDATITASTVSGNTANTAGGGIYSAGTLALTASTVEGNSALPAGGGIDNGGSLTVTASSIAGNTTEGGSGGAIWNLGGGDVSVGGSIVANNSAPECAGPITDDPGYNLEDDAADTCEFTGSTDVTADPELQPLASYGGPTETMALEPASPALDRIPDPTPGLCPGTDQRGVPRPQGIACDLGAFELATLTITAPSPAITYGQAIPMLRPSYAGFVAGLAPPAVPATCTTSATSTSPPGRYAVTCSGAVDPDYVLSYVSGTLTIGFTQACIVHVHGNLVVASGQAICLSAGGVVHGTLRVLPGGALWVDGGIILGTLSANGAAALGLSSSAVIGSVTITSSAGHVSLGGARSGNLFVGAVTIRNGSGGLGFVGNVVLGSLTITGNRGGFSFSGNIVFGPTLVMDNS